MIYIVDKFEPELLSFYKRDAASARFDFWEVTEEKVSSWIANDRTKTISDKYEIIDFFKVNQPVQMKKVTQIPLQLYDKIIFWTADSPRKFFVLELVGFINYGSKEECLT